MTNFEKLTQSPAGLGAFLRGLPILEGPWDNEFHKRYCRKCPSYDPDTLEENCETEDKNRAEIRKEHCEGCALMQAAREGTQ